MTIDQNTAMIVVFGIVGVSMINELVKVFFARLRSSDFVKKSTCIKCQSNGAAQDQKQTQKIDAIAKLVLAMAVKMGVDVKDIQGLI